MSNPTDTNQASELFELCKEVYERTGWEDVRDFYHENDSFDEVTQAFKRNGTFSLVERRRADYDIPLYTSDYLLEKLPSGVFVQKDSAMMGEKQFYVACMVYLKGTPKENRLNCGDKLSPLKALLKLTIALSEAGELK